MIQFEEMPKDFRPAITHKTDYVLGFIGSWDYIPTARCIRETFEVAHSTALKAFLINCKNKRVPPVSITNKEIEKKRHQRSSLYKYVSRVFNLPRINQGLIDLGGRG